MWQADFSHFLVVLLGPQYPRDPWGISRPCKPMCLHTIAPSPTGLGRGEEVQAAGSRRQWCLQLPSSTFCISLGTSQH